MKTLMIGMIDQGMSLPNAMKAGRIQSVDTAMIVEMHEGTSWTEANLEMFRSNGYNVIPLDRPGSFGRVHAIYYDAENGTWTGSADPDWEGTSDYPRLDE